jgi:hypothetical protein
VFPSHFIFNIVLELEVSRIRQEKERKKQTNPDWKRRSKNFVYL